MTSWHDVTISSSKLVLCDGNPKVAGGFPSIRTSNEELWCFPLVSLNNLSDKHQSCSWVETWWCSSKITLTSTCSHKIMIRNDQLFWHTYFHLQYHNMKMIPICLSPYDCSSVSSSTVTTHHTATKGPSKYIDGLSRYCDFHYKDKTVRPSYLYKVNPYTSKTSSNWDGTQRTWRRDLADANDETDNRKWKSISVQYVCKSRKTTSCTLCFFRAICNDRKQNDVIF